MSLLEEMMEEYTILDKTTTDDGYGGTTQAYVPGATIMGAMSFDSSIQARVAEAQGVKSVYTFTTRKNVVLSFHDVLQRKRDSKIFRVTSDGDDKFTPPSAGLDMRQVTAEEWVLPSEVESGQSTGA